jgi:thymidylate kinase
MAIDGSGSAEAPDHARSISSILEILDESGIACSLLRGQHGRTSRVGGDVDIVTPAPRSARFASALSRASQQLGVLLVGFVDHDAARSFVLARRRNGSHSFLHLDAWPDPDVRSHHFYAGDELLRHGRREHSLWVPSTAIEFGCLLTRRIAKGALGEPDAARLSELYARDRSGCEREMARFWGPDTVGEIALAADSARWDDVRAGLGRLRAELLRREVRGDLVGSASRRMTSALIRLERLMCPSSGLHVVFLGPDGSGKSTLIEAVAREIGGAFSGTSLRTVAPSLSQLRDGSYRTAAPQKGDPRAARPQGLSAHPLVPSLVKIAFWLFYYAVLYQFTIRTELARGRLVLSHRYLLDALVDPKRYRYGGPRWVLGLLWRIVPKPDVVLLLDAPADVVLSRKAELPYDEIVRQRAAYLALIRALPNGHVLDATQPFARMADAAIDVLLGHMAQRAARRLSLRFAP